MRGYGRATTRVKCDGMGLRYRELSVASAESETRGSFGPRTERGERRCESRSHPRRCGIRRRGVSFTSARRYLQGAKATVPGGRGLSRPNGSA